MSPGPKRKTWEEFLEKAKTNWKLKPDTGCWLWLGSTNEAGYGVAYFVLGKGDHGRALKAHRILWEIYKGKIPNDLCTLHACDNRLCVNPSHLFLGTRKDNSLDAKAKGRHKKGKEHPMAKLSEQDVIDIRGSSETQNCLVKCYGVSQSLICYVRTRKRWCHIH